MAKKKRNNTGNKFSKTKARLITSSWFIVVIVILYFIGRYIVADIYAKEPEPQPVDTSADLLQVQMPANVQNEVCTYKGFTVYFNSQYHIPNCVIYELTGNETLGEVPRAKNFCADENVKGCANPWDYSYSGYDRGHMAPAGDMKWDKQAMQESFYMTNICPQVKALNTGAWNRLEGRVREWAKRDSALIVITGPILSDTMPTIGESEVAVPPRFFKVLLAHRVNPIRAIAFIYDNARPQGKMSDHAVSVDSIERATGIDFFYSLPDDVESDVESRFDFKQWEQRNK